jgi:hypothetical protein
MHSGSIRSILSDTANNLALVFRLLHPLARYRVYNVEDTKLVCARRLFEVRKDLLDEYRLGLPRSK